MNDVSEIYGESLSGWITMTGRRTGWVAEQLGGSQGGLWSWRKGRTLPSSEMQARIAELTDGAVRPVAEVYRESLEARR